MCRRGQLAAASPGPRRAQSCTAPPVPPARLPPFQQLCLPSFLQQGVEGQEFLLLVFRFHFSFLKLLLGKDVFLLKAVFPNKFLLGLQLAKTIEMVKVYRACAWGVVSLLT